MLAVFRPGAAALVVALVLSAFPCRAALILDHAPAGVRLLASAAGGFSSADAAPAKDRRSDGHARWAAGLDDSASAVTDRFGAPGGGEGRDYVQGRIDARIELGEDSDTDIFTITYGGHASAVKALGSNKKLVDAFEHEHARYAFMLAETDLAPAGTVLGRFVLDPLTPTKAKSESVRAQLVGGGEVVDIPSSGGPVSVDVVAGKKYVLDLWYNIDVPHGIDPTGAYTYSASLVSVPEPSGCVMAALLALALVARPGRVFKPLGMAA
jgi:hypothetical protein